MLHFQQSTPAAVFSTICSYLRFWIYRALISRPFASSALVRQKSVVFHIVDAAWHFQQHGVRRSEKRNGLLHRGTALLRVEVGRRGFLEKTQSVTRGGMQSFIRFQGQRIVNRENFTTDPEIFKHHLFSLLRDDIKLYRERYCFWNICYSVFVNSNVWVSVRPLKIRAIITNFVDG